MRYVELKKTLGFTLIEMLIVIAIMSIIAVASITSYQASVLRGLRGDCTSYLMDLSARQERFFRQYVSYTDVIEATAACEGFECGLGLDENSSSRNVCTVDITVTPTNCDPDPEKQPNCTGYTLSASRDLSAAAHGPDDDCTVMTLTHLGQKGAEDYSGTSTDAISDQCWR